MTDLKSKSKQSNKQESKKIRALGLAVIETTIKALHTLSKRLDDDFTQACQYLLDCSGRIVVMGMGKSGHIARKIAATLASTGSPAFFVHPAEARHGDIGMITKNDVILVISKSGETEEIVSLLPFIKRLSIPLISITGKANSTIAKMASVNLDASVEKEACPLGLAPTTSTTTALVMGDALSIALLEKRGFTKQDFARSHPGGSLGRQLLLRVEEVMHQGENMPCVSHDALLKTALVEMTQKKLGMTTITNLQGELIGVFTDGDVRRAFDKNANVHQTLISEVMTKKPRVIPPETLAAEALQIMESLKITSLIVTNAENKPVGVIHMHDVLRAGVV